MKYINNFNTLIFSLSFSLLTTCLSLASDETINKLGLSHIWAHDGFDKVHQNELRARNNPAQTLNSTWDGHRVALYGAQNEVVSFNLVLEAGFVATDGIRISIDKLEGPDRLAFQNPTSKTNIDLFNWKNRNIEIFAIKYLPIKGLSKVSYETYDERHIPFKFRRPIKGLKQGVGKWQDRPDHDQAYPEIAVPLELYNNGLNVNVNQNQSIWFDIYIPKTTIPGIYKGTIKVSRFDQAIAIPLELKVNNFSLPDAPALKTMVMLGYSDLSSRYLGTKYPFQGSLEEKKLKQIRDRHFLLAHRHKLSLIDSDPGTAPSNKPDQPREEWLARLNGSLFSNSNGYAGPGTDQPNDVYSIGTYGSWTFQKASESEFKQHIKNWSNWFQQNSPNTDYFLYLADEATNYSEMQKWAQWIEEVKVSNKMSNALKSFATLPLPQALSLVPSLNYIASTFTVGDPTIWTNALNKLHQSSEKKLILYNGKRPATGSFAIEDSANALRVLALAQYKHKIDRWFYWESTYYNNFQGNQGETNLFKQAQTFGAKPKFDSVLGLNGWNYGNGDGVLFYPGTDRVFKQESLNLNGPLASLRLKYWRQGIQDVEYLKLAFQKNSQATTTILQSLLPTSLWEYGVDDKSDPTFVTTDISWDENNKRWEIARNLLTKIILGETFDIKQMPAPKQTTLMESIQKATNSRMILKKIKALIK